ncbi:hypothetical protein [Flavobacterium sp.]|jgi:hypothetical protein|uniref:hypothetical protein n=1 Tax=Flavobacterium sp. TaxID=239 RepID=UPI002A7FC79D|nr:hypothetical protein [Flavobacterium sp.]
MKYLGYLIRFISIYIFIALLMSVINLIKASNNDSFVSNAEKWGIILGQFTFVALVLWLNIKFYKYASKLILKSKNNSEMN